MAGEQMAKLLAGKGEVAVVVVGSVILRRFETTSRPEHLPPTRGRIRFAARALMLFLELWSIGGRAVQLIVMLALSVALPRFR